MLRSYAVLVVLALVACASPDGTGSSANLASDAGTQMGVDNHPGTATTTAGTTTSPVTTATNPNVTAAPAPLQGFTIVASNAPNLCVGVVGTIVDGATVALQPCDGTQNQRWIFEDGVLKTLNDKCFTTNDDGVTNFGESMVVRSCDGAVAQYWALYRGMIYATPSAQWIAFSPQGDSQTAGTPLVLVKYDSNDVNQHWVLNVTVPSVTGTGLTVSGFPIQDEGTPALCLAAQSGVVGFSDCVRLSSQQWLYNVQGGLASGAQPQNCLDVGVQNANVVAGTAPILQVCDNQQTQWWELYNEIILDGLNLNPNTSAAPGAFTPGVLGSNSATWSFGRGF